MALFTGHTITPDSALGGIQIDNSLRFEEDDTTYLSASPTFNTKKYTFSFWMKPVKKGGGAILSYNMVGNNRHSYSYDDYEGHFANQLRVGGSTKSQYATAAAFRDFTSWYHVVFVWDSDNGTQADRFIVYVNGVRAEMTQYTGTSSGVSGYIGGGNTIYIGRSTDGYSPARFYLADYHLIDGQAYDASYFGFTDAQTGQWRPKIYTGSYGSGGFHLEFKDSSNLGKDTSGNANNWTANNFSVSAGAGKDLVTDTPTNNFPTLNPLDSEGNLPTQGNLQGGTAGTSGWRHTRSTVFPTSGKWYWEVKLVDGTPDGSNGYMTGIAYPSLGLTQDVNSDSRGMYGRQNQEKYLNDNSNPVDSDFTTTADGDILQYAWDVDGGKLYTGKNNSWEESADPSAGTNANWTGVASGASPFVGSYGSSIYTIINFGQQPFSYTPPTGYASLSGHNRATANAAGVVRPQRFFDTVLYTGNGGSQSITSLEFQPDLIWCKTRDDNRNHVMTDSVRGRAKGSYPDDSQGEFTDGSSNGLVSFDANGFTLGAPGGASSHNKNGQTIVAWCWKAGGAAVSNTDGSITSSVSVNEEAGFSIITYTGTGSVATVGHGLGKVPKWFIIKRRDSSANWQIYHDALGNTHNLYFTSGSKNDDDIAYNDTSPTSSVFTIGTSSSMNANGGTYVAYCWTSIPGYSKFGSYTGNSSDDGPFVHLGFKPAWLMVKRQDGSGTNWTILDNKRDIGNVTNTRLFANSNEAESVSGGGVGSVDFLSNGFKVRDSHQDGNSSSGEYIYMAFAERPSGTMFGLDANAR